MKTSSFLICSLSPALFLFGGCKKAVEKPVKRPNILIAINDDQSFAHTSFAGCRFVKTPGFDRVAANGIYFTNCFSGSPGSAPARSSLVTGRYPWQNEQSGQHASTWMKKYVPVADIFAANGYHTGFTGKGVDPFRYAHNEEDSLLRRGNAAGIGYFKYRYDKKKDPSAVPTKGIAGINYYENFKYFMEERKEGEPFYFWYGSWEPHRDYEQDSWKRSAKKLSDVDVPGFLPASDVVKGDLLDYAIEIEWADSHLYKMLDYLDSIGELDNTIVIATGDNGMPFPNAKALCIEYGSHVPLAISYPKGFPKKRIVEDPVSFVDIVPTLLEMADIKPEGMMPISGRSIVNILESEKQGVVDASKKYVLSGRERHSSSRWNNVGYPQRAIRSTDYLLVWNMKPERWPAGAPQTLNAPMYGLDKKGIHHAGQAFTDLDPSPTKSFMVENYKDKNIRPYFDKAFLKRPEYELYNIKEDPWCMKNLSGEKAYESIEKEMKSALLEKLKATADPRVVGPEKGIFDTYERYMGIRKFPKPDWAE